MQLLLVIVLSFFTMNNCNLKIKTLQAKNKYSSNCNFCVYGFGAYEDWCRARAGFFGQPPICLPVF